DIDDVRHRVVVFVPDVLGDLDAAHDLAGVTDEKFEQRVLLRGQLQIVPADRSTPATRVDRERTDRNPVGQERLPSAADDGAQPRKQFAEIKRLDEIVV